MSIIDKIENGKQVGKVFSYDLHGEVVWSSVALQKWKGYYKVYIDEILESNMNIEEYEKEIIKKFSDFNVAVLFLESNSKIKFNDLSTIKGQKIFNPEFD